MDGWMRSHPGRIVTIYDVPSLVAETQLHSLTIRNIQNGFRVSGVHSYNRNVFTDEDFAPAEVTNCPDMGIVDCASDINDQQDPRIQNISDPDELSKQESSNSTGQKFANFKQPSTSSTVYFVARKATSQFSFVSENMRKNKKRFFFYYYFDL